MKLLFWKKDKPMQVYSAHQFADGTKLEAFGEKDVKELEKKMKKFDSFYRRKQ